LEASGSGAAVVMDLRPVEKGKQTMKIVGKQIVVTEVFARRSRQTICFHIPFWKHLATSAALEPFCFDAFSSRESVCTSLENALADLLPVRRRRESADNPSGDISPS
jgi:hypothetical protein